ncbi:MAG: protein kinase [Deltaproteobacteria bacterium]|nr:protein kinase [Deltaproteobacteria bacterium]
MDGDDSTVGFPTYAELTQTQGWSQDRSKAVEAEPEDSVGPSGQRYTEGALLGVGGMGKVMLARDARIGREVAVKELRSDREMGPDERVRFLREARVQGQLEHPSIVPVYDIDRRADGTTFFTMRRVVGRTLHAILDDLRRDDPAARTRYTQRELLTAFATVCLTIDYAHTRGVIHRDIKPANLMLGDFGEVYVLDWGLARLVGEGELDSLEPDQPPQRLSVPGELMGTPLYMAPEQMQDPGVGPAADVFALGAILFEILTLQKLRTAETLYLPANARTSERAPERAIAPELETICVRATETEPADRYPTPRALQEAVVRYLEGDREVAQRKALAKQHADRAREAIARADEPGADHGGQHGIAIRELNLALALDPADTTHASLLGQILTTPPREIPPEVHKQMQLGTDRLVRSGAQFSILGMSIWFVFLPAVLVIGVRSTTQLLAVIIPAMISGAASVYATLQKRIGRGPQLVTVGCTLLAASMLSRMFGPLILVPTLIASYAIVLQAHPARLFRRLALVASIVALAVPILLELAGILPASYAFEGGRWLVEPQMIELPPLGTQLLLMVTNMAMIIVPCVFIAKLRSDLSEVQARQLTQAWQFKRLATRV